MNEIKWIKLAVSMFDNEKIDFIESLPDSDTILIVWIKLLALAGKCNDNGFIYLTETLPYSPEMLAHNFRRPLNTVKFALKTFHELEMIELSENNIIKISNWEKHQNIEGMEVIKEKNRARKQRQREKDKLLLEYKMSRDSHVTVTEESRDMSRDVTQQNKSKNKREIYNNPPPPLSPSVKISQEEGGKNKFLGILSSTRGYPYSEQKDIKLYQFLVKNFSEIDVNARVLEWIELNIISGLENPRRRIPEFFKVQKNKLSENKPHQKVRGENKYIPPAPVEGGHPLEDFDKEQALKFCRSAPEISMFKRELIKKWKFTEEDLQCRSG